MKKFLLSLLFFVLITSFCYADLILHNTTKETVEVRVEWVNPPDHLIDGSIFGRFNSKYEIAVGEMEPGRRWKLKWEIEEGEIFIIRWTEGWDKHYEPISEKKVIITKEMKDVISEPGKDLQIILKEKMNNGL